MEELRDEGVDYRSLALPLCLLSPAFFLIYVFVVSWLLSGAVRSVMGLVLPFSGASLLAGNFPTIMAGLALLIPAAGSVLVFRTVKGHPALRTPALLLCMVFGLIIVCSGISIAVPDADLRKYAGLIALVAYAGLPLALVHIIGSFGNDEVVTTGSGSLRSLAIVVGIYGLFFALLLAFATLTYVPPAPDPRHDNFLDFDPLALIAAFFGLIDLLFLMPVVGLLAARTGIRFRGLSPAAVEPGGQPQPPNEEKTRPARIIPGLTAGPWVRRAAVVLALICIVAVAGFAYWTFIDTSPGKTWTRVTADAPFGPKGGFASAEFRDRLWIIGGTGSSGTYGEAWSTPDGITWTRDSSPDMAPQRMGASAVVFKNALWLIGGLTERSGALHNDVWYSENGVNWSVIQPDAGFSPRVGAETAVFRGRLFVIGGNAGTSETNCTNDVWSSYDGVSWQQETPAAEFPPRSHASVLIYHDRLWLIGGYGGSGYLNDVWSSEDGIHWTEVTQSAAFAKDSPASSVVFDGRLWAFQNFYVTDMSRPWVMDHSQGIWTSTDGSSWTKLMTSPEFFREEYTGQPPLAVVFDNRLWVLQEHNVETGIWFTMPAGPASCKPSAIFHADKATGQTPLTVKFTDESLCRPDQWQWDFGDGTQSSEQNPEHTFTAAGNYSVRLRVKNSAGVSPQSMNITVFRSIAHSSANAGKNWVRATDNVQFGKREGYSLVIWNNSMWVIAGNKPGGLPGYNDTWYSRDGSHWTQVVQNAAFETRSRHSTVVFNDKLWLIGGITDYLNKTGWHFPTTKNDVWSSADGANWMLATPATEFPPQDFRATGVFDNQIWLFGSSIWHSSDGIHWNRSETPDLFLTARITPVVKDGRLWVLQYESNGGYWNSPDGITRNAATLPPYSMDDYTIYTDSLVVNDNKFWLFRALEKREGHESLHGEIWSSDDGYNWVLVTNTIPFTDGAIGLNDFHLISFDNKLWAYMDRLSLQPFSDHWNENMEIWYSDMS